MKRKKPILVWNIEDDEVLRRQHGEFFKGWFPGCQFEAFPDAFTASKAEGAPDLLLIDVAGMTGGIQPVGIDLHNFTRLAQSVIERHPGAAVGLYSAVGYWARGVIEELKSLVPDVHVEQLDLADSWSFREFAERHLDTSAK